MKKIDTTKVKETAKTIGACVGAGFMATLYVMAGIAGASIEPRKESINEERFTYWDVMEELSNSNMWSSDKDRVAKIVKRDGDSGYYKAVIRVIKSDEFGSDKIRLIKIYNED